MCCARSVFYLSLLAGACTPLPSPPLCEHAATHSRPGARPAMRPMPAHDGAAGLGRGALPSPRSRSLAARTFPCPFLCSPASKSPTHTPPGTTPALPPTAHAPFAPRVCAQERTRSAPTSSRWTCSRRRSTTTWRRGRVACFIDEMSTQMAVQSLDKIILRGSTLSGGGGRGGKGRWHVPLGAESRAGSSRGPDPQPHTLPPPLPPPNPRPPVRSARRRSI